MSDTVKVRYNGVDVEVARGKTLLAAVAKTSIRQLKVCGGRGLCSTCRVRVDAGADNLSPMQAKERVSLRAHLSFSGRVRLACQARVCGPVTVASVFPTWGLAGRDGQPAAAAAAPLPKPTRP